MVNLPHGCFSPVMKSMSSLLLKFLSNWAERIVDLFYIDGTAVLVKSFGCNRSHTLPCSQQSKNCIKRYFIFYFLF